MDRTGPCRESDDDDVSLTSTVEETWDDDDEWNVEEVMAQVHRDGEKMYLIRWEQDSDLAKATWEPHGNLSTDTVAAWEEKRKESISGLARKFTIKEWVDARIRDKSAKYARHDKRNRIRQERGMEQTRYNKTLSEEEEEAKSWLRFENEDSEDGPLIPNGRHHTKHNSSLQPRNPDSFEAQSTPRAETKKNRPRGDEEGANAAKIGRRHSSDLGSVPNAAIKRQSHLGAAISPPSARNAAIERRPSLGAAISPPSTASPLKVSSAPPPKVSIANGSQKSLPMVSRKSKSPNKTTTIKGPKPLQRPSNIFIEGKSHRSRPTLSERAVNPETEPQKLRHRYTNILKRNSRNKDGILAPEKLPKRLISLDPSSETYLKPTFSETSKKGSNIPAVDSSSCQNGVEDATARAPVNKQPSTLVKGANGNKEAERIYQINTAKHAWPEEAQTPLAKNQKKRKSVHFHEATLESVHTFSGAEESLFVPVSPSAEDTADETNGSQRPPTPKTSSRTLPLRGSPPPKRRKFLTQSREENQSLDIVRHCTISQYITDPIKLTFNSVSMEASEAWYREFSNLGIMRFDHLCIAQLHCRASSSSSFFGRQIARGIASVEHDGRLLVEQVADRLRLGSYGLVFYDEFICVVLYPSKCEAWEENENSISRTSDQPLRYIIHELGSEFRLASPTIPSYQGGGGSGDGVSGAKPLQRMSPETFFGVSYLDLVPPSQKKAALDQHSFFLLFPPYAYEAEKTLRRWLRSFNPNCTIRTSSASEHWSSFRNAPSGTLILHEDATRMIRQLPGLSQILSTSPAALSCWLFGRKVHAGRAQTHFSDKIAAANKELPSFQKIFSAGDLFLVTPSFVNSHPEQFNSLVSWICKRHLNSIEGGPKTKLVLPGGFKIWLLDLIAEKQRKKEAYKEQLDALPVERHAATGVETAQVRGLVKAWGELHRLVDAESDGEPLVEWAPSNIDPNDEQSLVNWLGKWSLENLDIARNFYVVGSAAVFGFQSLSPWLPNEIQVPKYRQGPLAEMNDRSHQGQSSSDRHEGKLSSIGSFLKQLNKMLTSSPVVLNWTIVTHWTPELSSPLRNLSAPRCVNYQCWFDFLHPFDPAHRPARNTYAGFFYTSGGLRDDNKQSAARSPWFAIFRPVDPNVPEFWSNSELFIWDPAASQHYGGKNAVRDDDLIESHKQLVSTVTVGSLTQGHKPLSRVWLGGFEAEKGDAIDVTQKHFKKLLLNLRTELPAAKTILQGRGWHHIDMEQQPEVANQGTPLSPAPSSPALSASAPSPSEPDSKVCEKVVFAPPQGFRTETSHSRSNLLFDAAQKAIASGHDKMLFLFQPTMQWYTHQVQDGAGFEHITVGQWRKIFMDLNIHSSAPL